MRGHAECEFLQTLPVRLTRVSSCGFGREVLQREGWPRHQKENGAATFDGADGVVLVKGMMIS
jgi:hypothetical protein